MTDSPERVLTGGMIRRLLVGVGAIGIEAYPLVTMAIHGLRERCRFGLYHDLRDHTVDLAILRDLNHGHIHRTMAF